jgi:hypothetical protein
MPPVRDRVVDERNRTMTIPQWEGRAVPAVALWTAERVGPTMVETAQGWEPQPGTKWAKREHGMWMITGPTKREGRPDFGATHSARQRKMMERGLCQVCNEHVRGAMFWVIPDSEPHTMLWRAHLVLNAPVCEPCLQLAMSVCPFLANVGPCAVEPWGGRPVAVSGDLLDRPGHVVNAVAPLKSVMTRRMLGRELICLAEQ